MTDRIKSVLEDGLLSVDEAMAYLSVSRSHLYDLMERGAVAYAKIGRSRRIPKAALMEYVAANLKGLTADLT